MRTRLSEPFNLPFDCNGPLWVAPMGGGPTTPELVAAVCEAGAFGTLAGAYLTPEQLRADIRKVRSLTKRPFGVNLFTPVPQPLLTSLQMEKALSATRVYRQELGLPDPDLTPPFHQDFDQQFEVVLEEAPAVFSFVFGRLDRSYLKEAHHRKIFTIGTATTVQEGLMLRETGVQAVIAQGIEAGGHRAMFSPEAEDPGLGTLELTRDLVQKVKIPVIASGGIMDGRGIALALQQGARAAQLGTAFLLCPEAGTSRPYRKALRKSKSLCTRLTRAFSGRWARGLENRFLLEMESNRNSILPFPAQNAFTRDIRQKASLLGKEEFLSLWAGTGVKEIREASAAELVGRLLQECKTSSS